MRLKSVHTAAFIKLKRMEKKATQLQLAKHVGVSEVGSQIISNVERGAVQLPYKWVPKVAEFLGVEVDELIERMAMDYQQSIRKELFESSKAV